MRVVLDTNVLVSAALKQGSLPALAVRLAAEWHTVLKSSATEAQLREVIARPYLVRLIPEATRRWLLAVFSRAEAVTIVEQINACRDPTDDKFLELLTNGQGDVLVSGDKDLLVLGSFREIPIVTPARFVADWQP